MFISYVAPADTATGVPEVGDFRLWLTLSLSVCGCAYKRLRSI